MGAIPQEISANGNWKFYYARAMAAKQLTRTTFKIGEMSQLFNMYVDGKSLIIKK